MSIFKKTTNYFILGIPLASGFHLFLEKVNITDMFDAIEYYYEWSIRSEFTQATKFDSIRSATRELESIKAARVPGSVVVLEVSCENTISEAK